MNAKALGALAWGHGKGHPKFEAFDMSLPSVYMCAVLTHKVVKE
jgi:hypothetical protein